MVSLLSNTQKAFLKRDQVIYKTVQNQITSGKQNQVSDLIKEVENTTSDYKDMSSLELIRPRVTERFTFEPIFVEFDNEAFSNINEGVNVMSVANVVRTNGEFTVDPKKVKNLLGILSRKKNTKRIFFNDRRYFLMSFANLLSFLRLLILLPVARFLFIESREFGECLKQSAEGCPEDTLSKIFLISLFLIEAVCALSLIYDLTQAGSALIGNQTFRERTKFEPYLELVNFRGRLGLWGLRALAILCIVISSYYGKDGMREETLKFMDLLMFPVDNFPEEVTMMAYVKYLTNPKILFDLLLVLTVASLLRKFFRHPYLSVLAEHKRFLEDGLTENYGTLSKTATFILTLNTISFCFCISLVLKKLTDLITIDGTDVSFDFANSQLYILMLVIMLAITMKYLRAVLTVRTSKHVATFFLAYIPFFHFFMSFSGLEYIESPFIICVLLGLMTSCYVLNFLYVQIIYLFHTIRDEILFSLYLFFKRPYLSTMLSVSFCSLLVFAFINAGIGYGISWYEFTYYYCFGASAGAEGVSLLENIPMTSPGNDNLYVNIQRLFSVIPMVSIVIAGMYAIFDRRFNSFRVYRFWLALGIIFVNLSNYIGIQFNESVLDSLLDAGFVHIDFREEGTERIESATLMVISAMILDMIATIIAPAGVNVSYQEVRNPSFVERTKIDPKKILEVTAKNIVAETQNAKLEDTPKMKSTHITSLFMLIVYTGLFGLKMKDAFDNSWLTLVPNAHEDYTPVVLTTHFEERDFECQIDASSAPNFVNSFKAKLKEAADKSVDEIEIVDTSTKVLITSLPACYILISIVFFFVSLCAPQVVNPYQVMLFCNLFALPGFLFVALLPALVEGAVLSLVTDLRIDDGMFDVVQIFFLQLVLLLLMVVEKMPIIPLYVGEGEIKLATMDKTKKTR